MISNRLRHENHFLIFLKMLSCVRFERELYRKCVTSFVALHLCMRSAWASSSSWYWCTLCKMKVLGCCYSFCHFITTSIYGVCGADSYLSLIGSTHHVWYWSYSFLEDGIDVHWSQVARRYWWVTEYLVAWVYARIRVAELRKLKQLNSCVHVLVLLHLQSIRVRFFVHRFLFDANSSRGKTRMNSVNFGWLQHLYERMIHTPHESECSFNEMPPHPHINASLDTIFSDCPCLSGVCFLLANINMNCKLLWRAEVLLWRWAPAVCHSWHWEINSHC